MEVRLELGAVVGLDDEYPERKSSDNLVSIEADG